ncbi:MAG: hypothetical protein FJ290_00860 [Planctomycetes bacterium]|nr:hypothetical protein [Planctomycetota bacterium]
MSDAARGTPTLRGSQAARLGALLRRVREAASPVRGFLVASRRRGYELRDAMRDAVDEALRVAGGGRVPAALGGVAEALAELATGCEGQRGLSVAEAARRLAAAGVPLGRRGLSRLLGGFRKRGWPVALLFRADGSYDARRLTLGTLGEAGRVLASAAAAVGAVVADGDAGLEVACRIFGKSAPDDSGGAASHPLQ